MDMMTLGMVDEIHQHIDITHLCEDHGIDVVIGYLHKISFRELMSRSIDSMWGWELRTKHMFENNKIQKIGDVTSLEVGKVNRLIGCGYKTRKEVYDVFCVYHLRLKNWSPNGHWEKMNYRF